MMGKATAMKTDNDGENKFTVTARALLAQHQGYAHGPIVTIEEAGQFLNDVLAVLFPHLSSTPFADETVLTDALVAVRQKLVDMLQRVGTECVDTCNGRADDFIAALPSVSEAIRLDAIALVEGDPAAGSLEEVIMAYPGCYAVAAYRIAHPLYAWPVPLFPRLISEYAHRVTGIDINPGAQIGESFYVDHGTAVVIGETAVIGDHVKIYQGVTLGALSVKQADKNVKRHPTIEDNVVVYANATILGGETIVGHDSIIGGNVWLTRSVLPFSRVMYKSSDVAASGLDWDI